MARRVLTLWNNIINLIYPNVCIGCDQDIAVKDSLFCMDCSSKVSYTIHFKNRNNDLLSRLGPRVELSCAAALYNFIKGGRVRQLVHSLKYKKRQDIGHVLGKEYGRHLLRSTWHTPTDFLIPIPIHKKRLATRGYNQSLEFAKGITEVTGIPIRKNVLIKTSEIKSQTKKSREDRFANVLDSFSLKKTEGLEGKTIMIIDDVLTTGATIEAAYTRLKTIPNINIQLGLIALADE